MNRSLDLYSIFYYNMINILVLLIIQVLIILKHFGIAIPYLNDHNSYSLDLVIAQKKN